MPGHHSIIMPQRSGRGSSEHYKDLGRISRLLYHRDTHAAKKGGHFSGCSKAAYSKKKVTSHFSDAQATIQWLPKMWQGCTCSPTVSSKDEISRICNRRGHYSSQCMSNTVAVVSTAVAEQGLWNSSTTTLHMRYISRAWFLEITSVQMYACVYVCVCVSAPEAIND